jgi:internalin A
MTKEYQNEATKRIQETLKTGAVELDLSDLGLTEIPELIAQLTNRQELYLDNNKLTSLPDEIAFPTSLKSLIVSLLPGASQLCKRLIRRGVH